MTGNEMKQSKSYIDNRHHSTFSDFRNSNLIEISPDRQTHSRLSKIADSDLYSNDIDYTRTTESKYLKRKESDKDLGDTAEVKEDQKTVSTSKSTTYTVSLQAPNTTPQDSESQIKPSGNSPVERKKFLDKAMQEELQRIKSSTLGRKKTQDGSTMKTDSRLQSSDVPIGQNHKFSSFTGYNTAAASRNKGLKNQYHDHSLHRDHGPLNFIAPSTQTRTHSKYISSQLYPNNTEAQQTNYNQQRMYIYDNPNWRVSETPVAEWHNSAVQQGGIKKPKKKKPLLQILTSDNPTRGTPTPAHYNPPRNSRLDSDQQGEDTADGQLSAREAGPSQDQASLDNRERIQYAKQAMALRKLTKTPVDKGTRLQPLQKSAHVSVANGPFQNTDQTWTYHGHGKMDMDTRAVGSISALDISARAGWMSRPQSVLGGEETFIGEGYLSPREQGDFRSLKGAKLNRFPSDFRGTREADI
ncbi:hypothetical protein ScPMuIL_011047 [Solemya velum]